MLMPINKGYTVGGGTAVSVIPVVFLTTEFGKVDKIAEDIAE